MYAYIYIYIYYQSNYSFDFAARPARPAATLVSGPTPCALKASRRGQDKRGRRRSAAIPCYEISLGNVGKI